MKVIMSCAGTGGHIYPAIAIADKIRRMKPEAEILFVGTKQGMEQKLIVGAGYDIKGIDASGFDRKNLLKNFKTVFDIYSGGKQSEEIIREFKPDLVIGTGGYVTGIFLRKASKMGVRCFIHEQNAIPGVANKMLQNYVEKIFISFEESRNYFDSKDKLVLSGNPIRKEFLIEDVQDARAKLGLEPSDFMLLATGGSLGAALLNDAIIDLVKALADAPRGVKLYFVSGKRYYDEVREKLSVVADAKDFVQLIDYAENMPTLMCAADLVISRAGGSAVSEIVACGKPSVLVPSPNVTNNHQHHNAKAVADASAAVMIEEDAIRGDLRIFTSAIMQLILNRERLNLMAQSAKNIGIFNAVDIIYEHIKI